MKVYKMYQYAVRKVEHPLETETWMNERADEGFRLEKIMLKRGLEGQHDEIWIFMESEEDMIEEDFDDED